MKEIKRNQYLKQLLSYRWDGQIKVITGIRRCGKSYLLGEIYRNYLLGEGVKESSIISIQLDLIRDIRFRNPLELSSFVLKIIENKQEKFYLFIDEIQMSDEVPNPYLAAGKNITFYDALNELREAKNLDVYVTGSNSKMLSSDILTEFRGRSDEIHVHPLSFCEYYSAVESDKEDALENILDLLASSIGSLTNLKKITDTINSKKNMKISQNTVTSYIHFLEDAFLFSEAKRYDVRGKSYFDYPYKY